MMGLRVWLNNDDEVDTLLPMFHTTRTSTLNSILDTGCISSKFSKFPDPDVPSMPKENISYFFYGMPFYLLENSKGELIPDIIRDIPIGLIFKPSISEATHRFFPFDTGAFFSNMYSDVCNLTNSDDVEQYRCEVDEFGSEIKKYVNRYFSTNKNYISSVIDFNAVENDDYEKKLVKLLNYNLKGKVDLRCKALEAHSNKDIKLSQYLQAVVVPKGNIPKFKKIIDTLKNSELKIEILEYKLDVRYNPISNREALMERTKQYYKDHSTI